MLTIYGIRNCDSCRAAIKWFATQGCEIEIHDLRTDGVDLDKAKRWLQELGSDKLVNRRSLTWKSLPAGERENLDDAALLKLVLAHPTLIKRPLLDDGERVMVGYDITGWQETFLQGRQT